MKNKKKKILLALPILIIVILTTLVLTKTVDLTKILGLVNPMDLKSSDVPYTNNSQSTVQGAIDDLYTKATPDNILTTKVFANKTGVCIYRKGRVHCFKINNWAEEKTHIRQVFSDLGALDSSTGLGCEVYSSFVSCNASDFYCAVVDDGSVKCTDNGTYEGCDVDSSGVCFEGSGDYCY